MKRSAAVPLAAVLLGTLAGCGSGEDKPPLADQPYLTALPTAEHFAAMSDGTEREVKYLAPVSGKPVVSPLSDRCYFQNMVRYSWHLLFLRSFSELSELTYDGYLTLVMAPSSRRLWGGGVKPWPDVVHPLTGAPGVMVYTIYGEPGSVDAAAIRELDATMKACVPYARDRLVFVPEPHQSELLAGIRAQLAADGIASLFAADLIGPPAAAGSQP